MNKYNPTFKLLTRKRSKLVPLVPSLSSNSLRIVLFWICLHSFRSSFFVTKRTNDKIAIFDEVFRSIRVEAIEIRQLLGRRGNVQQLAQQQAQQKEGVQEFQQQQQLVDQAAGVSTASSTGGARFDAGAHNHHLHDLVMPLAGAGRRGGAAAATAVAGAFSNIWKKFTNRELDWVKVRKAVHVALDTVDVAALVMIGWCTEPLARYWYKWNANRKSNRKNNQQQLQNPAQDTTSSTDASVTAQYEDSWLFKTANVVQELGRIGTIMYLFDIVSIVFRKVGFQLSPQFNGKIFSTVITVWTASRIRRLKQIWLAKIMKQNPEGRAAILSRVLDGVLGVIVFSFVHDIFQITVGNGLQSLAAVGGLTTIIFSLAAKDFAEMLLAGVAIYNSDKFFEGEYVRFGDNTAGVIVSQGAFELQIRGSDGIVTRIPNGQITNQRVQNLSRTPNSTIKQILWFRYEDINKLPIVLDSIKEEIILSCPKLINDGSRKFRALWTDYKQDHLEAIVEASFTISPTSNEHDINKQTMLQAIARAVEKNGVEFALPTSLCLSEERKVT